VRNPYHGEFDDIGGRALNRRVDRGALGHTAPHAVPRIDFRMLADAAEQCSSHSEVARETETILDVALHALILLEVFRDEIRGFLRTDPELLRKPERRLTVHNSEIHCFCAFSL